MNQKKENESIKRKSVRTKIDELRQNKLLKITIMGLRVVQIVKFVFEVVTE